MPIKNMFISAPRFCFIRLSFPADLQPLAADINLGPWQRNSLLTRRSGLGLEQPFPAHLATLHVDRPHCAAAVPNLRLPVIVVGRNRECIRERGRDHHADQHSDQKDPHPYSHSHTSLSVVRSSASSWFRA